MTDDSKDGWLAGARLNRSGARPLSKQIAIYIRYLMATGAIPAGERMPSLREGAAALGVNMHTMRAAYHSLTETGYLDAIPSYGFRAGAGTPPGDALATEDIDAFLARFRNEARSRYGLSGHDLAELLQNHVNLAPDHGATFIECSLGQAGMHGAQLEKTFGAPCRPVEISPGAREPQGFAVTTFFHLDEIEAVWPGIGARLHSVRVAMAQDMQKTVAEVGAQKKITICEYDDVLGHRILCELAAVARRDPSDFELRRVEKGADPFFASEDKKPVFMPPRVWNRIPEDLRARANLRQIRYDIDKEDARRIEASFRRHQEAQAVR